MRYQNEANILTQLDELVRRTKYTRATVLTDYEGLDLLQAAQIQQQPTLVVENTSVSSFARLRSQLANTDVLIVLGKSEVFKTAFTLAKDASYAIWYIALSPIDCVTALTKCADQDTIFVDRVLLQRATKEEWQNCLQQAFLIANELLKRNERGFAFLCETTLQVKKIADLNEKDWLNFSNTLFLLQNYAQELLKKEAKKVFN